MKFAFIVFVVIINIIGHQVDCTIDFSEFEFNEPVDYNTACGEPYDDEFPWLVNIYETIRFHLKPSKKFLCYGNIIDKYTILLPAQCVTLTNRASIYANDLSIELDNTTIPGRTASRTEYTCRDVIVHPNYYSTRGSLGSIYYDDIAILKLADPIEFSSYTHPICLTNDTSKFNTEQPGTVPSLAYLNGDRGKLVSNIVNLPINYNNLEHRCYGLRENNFCVGSHTDNYNLCRSQGASLTLIEETRIKLIWYLKGMFSSGGLHDDTNDMEICVPGYLLFTDVFKFYNWIIENKNKD